MTRQETGITSHFHPWCGNILSCAKECLFHPLFSYCTELLWKWISRVSNFVTLCFFCLMTYCEYAIGLFTKMHGLMFRCSSVGTHNPLQNSLPWDLWRLIHWLFDLLLASLNFLLEAIQISCWHLILGHDVQMFAEYMLDFTWFYLILVLEKAGFLRENNVTLNSEQQQGTKQNRCVFLTCAR